VMMLIAVDTPAVRVSFAVSRVGGEDHTPRGATSLCFPSDALPP
jgi:hypothetical protein